MDDTMILRALRYDFERIFKETQSWLKEMRDLEAEHPKVVNFFERLLGFYFQPVLDSECSPYEKQIREHLRTSLFGMLGFFEERFVQSSHPDLHELILCLVSFLRDICWGESTFDLNWVSISANPNDEVWATIDEKEVEGSSPQIASGATYDAKDADKLHYALDKFIEKERQYAKSLVNKV